MQEIKTVTMSHVLFDDDIQAEPIIHAEETSCYSLSNGGGGGGGGGGGN